MAKLIKFPLEMADGTKARNLDELKEHADIASIASYYKDGRLKRWLSCNYLDEKAEEVQSIKDSENEISKKAFSEALNKVVHLLGLDVSDSQISEYLENTSEREGKTSDDVFDVEDDANLKAEIAKHIHGVVNLDEWNLACEETDEADLYNVKIEQKRLGVYTIFSLKKDANFYLRIEHFIKNCKKSFCTDFQADADEVKKIAEFQARVQNFPRSVNGKSIPFGKYRWNVVPDRRNFESEGRDYLLVCEYPVKDARNDYEWLNSDFLRESFSDTEISYLKTDSAGHKVFFLSTSDILDVEKRERIKHDYKDYYAVRWWLSDGYVVNTDGSFANYRKERWDDVCVVPAILVSAEFNGTHFMCNNCGHDFKGSDTEKGKKMSILDSPFWSDLQKRL